MTSTVKGMWNTLSGTESAAIVDNMTDQDNSAFKFLNLSRRERLYAFGACVVAGFVLSILGSILFVLGQVTLFALLYVVGVVVGLVGSGFLWGFKKQAKAMMDPVRLYSVLVMLLFIALTFVFAFAVEIDPLVIVCAVGTWISVLWYTLSYIPFARDFVKRIFGI
ncbi:hypothetical protein JCM10212_006397 [Sporobolomyces blumeae]